MQNTKYHKAHPCKKGKQNQHSKKLGLPHVIEENKNTKENTTDFLQSKRGISTNIQRICKKKKTNSEAFLQKNKKYKTNLLTPIIKNIKIIY